MKFNEKLLNLRKQKGWSQEELGFKLNVTRQTISKWEIGDTSPKLEDLERLSELFEISIDELIGNENIKQVEEVKPKKKSKVIKIIKWILFIILALYLGYSVYKYLVINKFIKEFENVQKEFGYNYGYIEIITNNENIIEWKEYCNNNGALEIYDILNNTIKKEEHYYDETDCTKSICYEYDLNNKTYKKNEYNDYVSIINDEFRNDYNLIEEINGNLIRLDSRFFRKLVVALNPFYYTNIRGGQIVIIKGVVDRFKNFYMINLYNGENDINPTHINYTRNNINKNNKVENNTIMIQKITLEQVNELFETEMAKCILVEE